MTRTQPRTQAYVIVPALDSARKPILCEAQEFSSVVGEVKREVEQAEAAGAPLGPSVLVHFGGVQPSCLYVWADGSLSIGDTLPRERVRDVVRRAKAAL